MDAYKRKGAKPRNRIRQFWTLLLGPRPTVPYTSYTGTNTDSGATVGPTAELEASLSTPTPGTYHLQCSTLLYSTFVKIMLTKNISLLTISGTPTEPELVAAWQGILTEYVDLVASEKTRSILEVWKRLLYTQWKISFVDVCIYALKYLYDAEVAGCLAALGYGFVEHLPEREAYLRQIYMVETDAKFLVIQMNQLAAEYKALAPASGAGGADVRTEGDYDKELAILSRFMGFRLNKNELSVAEYAGIQNLYTEHNKAKNNG